MNRFASKSAILLAYVLAVFASAYSYGDEIYKWIDDKGQTHYGNSKPRSQNSVAEKVELRASIVDSPHLESVDQHLRGNAQPGDKPKSVSDTANAAPVNANGTSTGDKKSTCEEEWEKYRESLDCVAPYRTALGGIKEEVTQHCTIVKQPLDLCN